MPRQVWAKTLGSIYAVVRLKDPSLLLLHTQTSPPHPPNTHTHKETGMQIHPTAPASMPLEEDWQHLSTSPISLLPPYNLCPHWPPDPTLLSLLLSLILPQTLPQTQSKPFPYCTSSLSHNNNPWITWPWIALATWGTTIQSQNAPKSFLQYSTVNKLDP